jgi:hypothetical protein
MSLTIQLPVTTEHYLRENANRLGISLEGYISQLLTETSISTFSKKKKKSVTEIELLQNIQLDIQADDLREYNRLKNLFKLGEITEQERESLIQLNDLVEIAHAKRMQYVLLLAKLRQVPLDKLMIDLGIKQPTL